MSELKPCPFCGSTHITEWEVPTHAMFGCEDCRIGFDDGRDEENIRTWNTRAEPIMPDQIEIYRLIKSAGVRKHGEIAKVIADHLAKYGEPET